MQEMFLFLIGILWIIFVAWPLWKNALLDYLRDKLFDLRFELRNYCIDNNIPLDDDYYINTRILLNKKIRFLEDHNYTSILIFGFVFKDLTKKRSFNRFLKKKFEPLFQPEDPAFRQKIDNLRDRSDHVVMSFMIFTSPFLLTLSLLIFVFFLIKALIKKINLKNAFKRLNILIFKERLNIDEMAYYGSN